MPGGADIDALLKQYTSSKKEREILENYAGVKVLARLSALHCTSVPLGELYHTCWRTRTVYPSTWRCRPVHNTEGH
jgi:hypothetical protein